MIWEVDEDCDGMVSWVEFQTMYTRQVFTFGMGRMAYDTVMIPYDLTHASMQRER